jgi:hypothetical protein
MKMMSEQTKKRIMKPVIDHLKKVDRFEKKLLRGEFDQDGVYYE